MTDVDEGRIYRCGYCGGKIADNRDVIVLRTGKIQKSPKHGGFYFHPKKYDDGRIVRLFCFNCMLSAGFEFADAEDQAGPTECAFCPEDLLGEPRVFEVELGNFIRSSSGRMWKTQFAAESGPARLWSCWECVEQSLGEGNVHAFRQRIGMEPLDDQRRWIDRDTETDSEEILSTRKPRLSYADLVAARS